MRKADTDHERTAFLKSFATQQPLLPTQASKRTHTDADRHTDPQTDRQTDRRTGPRFPLCSLNKLQVPFKFKGWIDLPEEAGDS